MASFDAKSFYQHHSTVQLAINLTLYQIQVQDVQTFHGLVKTQPKKLLIWSCTQPIF